MCHGLGINERWRVVAVVHTVLFLFQICCSVLFERSDRSLLQRNYCCVNINPKSSFVRFGMHIELQCNGMTIACIDLLIRDKNVFVPMDITCPYPLELMLGYYCPPPSLSLPLVHGYYCCHEIRGKIKVEN